MNNNNFDLSSEVYNRNLLLARRSELSSLSPLGRYLLGFSRDMREAVRCSLRRFKGSQVRVLEDNTHYDLTINGVINLLNEGVSLDDLQGSVYLAEDYILALQRVSEALMRYIDIRMDSVCRGSGIAFSNPEYLLLLAEYLDGEYEGSMSMACEALGTTFMTSTSCVKPIPEGVRQHMVAELKRLGDPAMVTKVSEALYELRNATSNHYVGLDEYIDADKTSWLAYQLIQRDIPVSDVGIKWAVTVDGKQVIAYMGSTYTAQVLDVEQWLIQAYPKLAETVRDEILNALI